MRGEYPLTVCKPSDSLELPPRARRIQITDTTGGNTLGTTSACAENTKTHWPGSNRLGNYLRVRGEYWTGCVMKSGKAELPPRARRIHMIGIEPQSDGGTTSACAENTHQSCQAARRTGNYLRVRGEYS